MAKRVLTDVGVYVGPYDVTGETNKVMLNRKAAQENCDNFGSGGYEESVAGAKMSEFSFEGYMTDGQFPDDQIRSLDAVPVIIATDDATPEVGDPAIVLQKAVPTDIMQKLEVNKTASFTFQASGSGYADLGLFGGSAAAAAASAALGGVNIGAIGATQKLLVVLSVENAAAGTFDATVESDTANTFAGGETTRGTFNQVTTSPTSQWLVIDGAITDAWFRLAYAIAASGVYTFRVAFARVN